MYKLKRKEKQRPSLKWISMAGCVRQQQRWRRRMREVMRWSARIRGESGWGLVRAVWWWGMCPQVEQLQAPQWRWWTPSCLGRSARAIRRRRSRCPQSEWTPRRDPSRIRSPGSRLGCSCRSPFASIAAPRRGLCCRSWKLQQEQTKQTHTVKSIEQNPPVVES